MDPDAPRTPRRTRRLPRLLAGAAGLMLAAILFAWLYARPATPGAFYAPPSAVPAAPGMLLRSEPFSRGVPEGARGWKILYTTTRRDGVPAVASALVLAPRRSTATPSPLIVWTHGTTGVKAGCAPSLLAQPFAGMPVLQPVLAQGWAVVAPDYVGLGTPGPHPYLIGQGQARSTLDAIRAVRQLDGLRLASRTVVWGHSQGGNAALWTGMLAPTYAADIPLAGVAAAAPASDLPALVEQAQHTPIGRIMSAYILSAYTAEYPDVRLATYVSPMLQPLAKDLAGRCLADRRALFSVAEALLLNRSLFATPPTAGALGERLAANTPQGAITAPLLIAQGGSDDLVLPAIQERFVQHRCQTGQPLDYRTYPGLDHMGLVAADSPFGAELLQWTRERFKGTSATSACPRRPH